MADQTPPSFDDIPLDAYDDIYSQGLDYNVEADFGDYYASQPAPFDNTVSMVASNNNSPARVKQPHLQPHIQAQAQAQAQAQTQTATQPQPATQTQAQALPVSNSADNLDLTQITNAFNQSIDESSFFSENMPKNAKVNPDDLKSYLGEVADNVSKLESPYLDADIRFGIIEDSMSHYSVSKANRDIGGTTPNGAKEIKYNSGNVSGFARAKAIKNGSKELSQIDNIKPKKYSFSDDSTLNQQQKAMLTDVLDAVPPHVAKFIDKGVEDAKLNYPKDAFDFNETYSAVLQKASEYDALANSALPENKGLDASNQNKHINTVKEVKDATSIVAFEKEYVVDIPNYTPVSASEYAKNQRDKADGIKISAQLASKASSGANPPTPPNDPTAQAQANPPTPPNDPNNPKAEAQTNPYSELNVLLNAVDNNFTKDPKLDRIKDRLKDTNRNMSKLNLPLHIQVALLNHDFSQVGYSSAVSDLNDHNKKNPDNKKDYSNEVVKDYKKKYNFATRVQYRDSSNSEPDVSHKNSPLVRLKQQEQANDGLVERVGDATTIHLAEYALKNVSDGARLHVYDTLEKKFPADSTEKVSSKDVLKTVASTLRDFDDAYKEISSTDLKHTKTLEESFRKEYENQLTHMPQDIKNELRVAIDDAFDRKGLDPSKTIREKDWGQPTNILPNGKTKQDIKISPPDNDRVKINDNELKSLEEQSNKQEQRSTSENSNNGEGEKPKKTKPKVRYDKDGNPIPDEDENLNITTPRMQMGRPSFSLFGGKQQSPTPASAPKEQAGKKQGKKLTEAERASIRKADSTNPFGEDAQKDNQFKPIKPSYDFSNSALNDSFADLESQHKSIKEYFESDSFSSEQGYKLAEKYAEATDSFTKELAVSMDWNRNNPDRFEGLSKGLEALKKINKETEDLIKSKDLDNPDYVVNKQRKENGKKTLGDKFTENNEALSKLSENVSKFFSNLKSMITNKR